MFSNKNQTILLATISGMILGMLLIAIVDILISDSINTADDIARNLSKCVRSADAVNDDSYSQRSLRITDCMSGNYYLFTGTRPSSHCYSENIMHIQVKHIMPSCYESPKLISKFLKLLQIS